MSAEAVPTDEQVENNVHHMIPQFEGRNVELIDANFGGKIELEDDHSPLLSIDDRVRVSTIYSVTEVVHVNDKDGRLTRVAKLKAIQSVLIPFEPGKDNGVLRG